MAVGGVQFVDDPGVLAAAASPLRRGLLERLQEPASASELSKELGQSRQALNYHLRELERLGLVEVVGERQRRGFVERVFRSKARRLVVDPSVLRMSAADGDDVLPAPDVLDRHAAEHLAATAGRMVRDVAMMQEAAERTGRRLLTFTIEADVRIGSPADVERFADALADAVARTAADHDTPGGRHYRVVVGAHPTRAHRPDQHKRQGAS